jgi:hypothetical protein
MKRSVVKAMSRLTVTITVFVVLLELFWKSIQDNRRNTSIVASSTTTVLLKPPNKNRVPEGLEGHIDIADTNSSIENSMSSSVQSSLPLPLKVLFEYQKQHSDTVLWQEYNKSTTTTTNVQSSNSSNGNSRKFAVAYYWCPHRAGNILHYFFNSVVWSIIHNRTVLWKFHRLHNESNTHEECEAVLKRAKWIPSFDEWKERLELPSPVPVSNLANRSKEDLIHPIALFPQFPDGIFPTDEQKNLTRHGWADHPMKRPDSIEYINSLPSFMQETTDALYTHGQEFLYGMLYSKLFTLQLSPTEKVLHRSSFIVNKNEKTSTNDTDIYIKSLSIALHSRHTIAEDDGSYIRDEIKCLSKLLPTPTQQKTQHIPCSLYLMSDRERTIEQLTHWMIERNNVEGTGPDCNIITANHHTGNLSQVRKEHGPWSGAGFFQDLHIVGDAEHILIGDIHRSSTRLLLEVMEYRRRLLQWRRNDIFATNKTGILDQAAESSNIRRLVQCKLPVRSAHLGYDYGPGTPIFKNSISKLETGGTNQFDG